jgi:hypothetical protein
MSDAPTIISEHLNVNWGSVLGSTIACMLAIVFSFLLLQGQIFGSIWYSRTYGFGKFTVIDEIKPTF